MSTEREELDDALWEAFEERNGTTGHHVGAHQEVAFEAFAAGFRKQEPVSEGPARIVRMPPSPETSARYWEAHCPVCTTHEGMYRDANDERLIEIRDKHNARHLSTALPGPVTEAEVEAAYYEYMNVAIARGSARAGIRAALVAARAVTNGDTK